MMIPQFALTILLALSATATTSVDAHGKLLRPASRATASSRITPGQQYDFVGEIEGKKAFGDRSSKLNWARTPQQNQRQFAEGFTAAGYTTLRQFFQANDKIMKPRFPGRTDNLCGFTDPNAPPSTLPADGVLEWGHDKNKWGFQDNHYGPCEVWCDNTLVLRNDDCRSAFGKALPARMKIDAAQCAGAKQLQFMWLAVHFSKWQYWFNCVPLSVPTPAPVPTTAVPIATLNTTGSVPAVVPNAVPAPVSPAVPGTAVPAIPAIVPATGVPGAAYTVPAVVATVTPVAPLVPVAAPYAPVAAVAPAAPVAATNAPVAPVAGPYAPVAAPYAPVAAVATAAPGFTAATVAPHTRPVANAAYGIIGTVTTTIAPPSTVLATGAAVAPTPCPKSAVAQYAV